MVARRLFTAVRSATIAFGMLLPVCAQAQVHLVAVLPGPGVDCTTTQGAVDTASNGDVVLIKLGGDAGICVDGRGTPSGTLTLQDDQFDVALGGFGIDGSGFGIHALQLERPARHR